MPSVSLDSQSGWWPWRALTYYLFWKHSLYVSISGLSLSIRFLEIVDRSCASLAGGVVHCGFESGMRAIMLRFCSDYLLCLRSAVNGCLFCSSYSTVPHPSYSLPDLKVLIPSLSVRCTRVSHFSNYCPSYASSCSSPHQSRGQTWIRSGNCTTASFHIKDASLTCQTTAPLP